MGGIAGFVELDFSPMTRNMLLVIGGGWCITVGIILNVLKNMLKLLLVVFIRFFLEHC